MKRGNKFFCSCPATAGQMSSAERTRKKICCRSEIKNYGSKTTTSVPSFGIVLSLAKNFS